MSFSTGIAPINRSMTKEEILAKASDLVSNDRNKSHGDAFNNQL